MNKFAAWIILLALALILISAGAQGRLGSVLAALITPSALIDA